MKRFPGWRAAKVLADVLADDAGAGTAGRIGAPGKHAVHPTGAEPCQLVRADRENAERR